MKNKQKVAKSYRKKENSRSYSKYEKSKIQLLTNTHLNKIYDSIYYIYAITKQEGKKRLSRSITFG